MAIEPRIPLRAGRRPDRLEFGVGRGIVARQHVVDGGRDNLPILDQQRPERAALPYQHIVEGQLNGQGEVLFRR